MIDLQTKPLSLIENHRSVESLLTSYGPESLARIRTAALERFAAVGIPTRKDEEFRYVDLKPLENTVYRPAYGATVGRDEAVSLFDKHTAGFTLAFVNGEYAPELSNPCILPEGVTVGTLKEGLEEHETLVMSHLGHAASLDRRLGSTNDQRFFDLNTAFLSEGAFVFVPKGVVLESPIEILWISKESHGPFASHPRTLIVLEEAAQAKVVESFVGVGGHYFTNSISEMFVGQNGLLEYTKYQDESLSAIHISTVAARQQQGSTYTSNMVNFGGSTVRHDINVILDGQHTETWLNGASTGFGEQTVDNHTRIDHATPNCHSFETYKTVLGGRATGVFNGKIFVYPDAQKTDAKQTNKALLLSAEATYDTKPQLEIFADDVKCTHGATVGQMRKDALFYLQARGIPKSEAESLLVYAFVAEVLDKITIPEAREAVEHKLFDRLMKGRKSETA